MCTATATDPKQGQNVSCHGWKIKYCEINIRFKAKNKNKMMFSKNTTHIQIKSILRFSLTTLYSTVYQDKIHPIIIIQSYG